MLTSPPRPRTMRIGPGKKRGWRPSFTPFANYKQTAQKMIESMFSDKTTPAQREEIRSKMTATPQYVMASAMEGMLAMEAPKPREIYSVPVLAIMAGKPGGSNYEAQLRAVFPNLGQYEAWVGSGHFLMMESAD